MRRTTNAVLMDLAADLSSRDREITETVGRLRLITAAQLQRLFFTGGENPASDARLARRTLARLVGHGVLGRLERRIGGIRAGAAGHTYYLAAAGQRLAAYWRGEGLQRTRSPYEPTVALVRHTLAIAECYVRAVETDRQGTLRLLSFEAEPDCWRSFTGDSGEQLTLKPDARLALGLNDGEQVHAWLEIDCGTEGRRALERKCRMYLAAYQAGVEPDVFPQVTWIATTTRRAQLITEVCGSLPAEAWQLFAVTTPEHALALLTGTLAQTGGAS